MRRFSISPGQGIDFELIPDDEFTGVIIRGFDWNPMRPMSIKFVLNPDELVRLGEAVRQAVKDARANVAPYYPSIP